MCSQVIGYSELCPGKQFPILKRVPELRSRILTDNKRYSRVLVQIAGVNPTALRQTFLFASPLCSEIKPTPLDIFSITYVLSTWLLYIITRVNYSPRVDSRHVLFWSSALGTPDKLPVTLWYSLSWAIDSHSMLLCNSLTRYWILLMQSDLLLDDPYVQDPFYSILSSISRSSNWCLPSVFSKWNLIDSFFIYLLLHVLVFVISA
jgi:hypothetical protein